MKNLVLTLLTLVLLIGVTSCKKDHTCEPKPPYDKIVEPVIIAVYFSSWVDMSFKFDSHDNSHFIKNLPVGGHEYRTIKMPGDTIRMTLQSVDPSQLSYFRFEMRFNFDKYFYKTWELRDVNKYEVVYVIPKDIHSYLNK